MRVAFLTIFTLVFASITLAQTFTKITDSGNPIVSNPGPAGYSGAAWIDFDNDRDLDLFVNNSQLYRNDGGGVFTDLATNIGADQPTGGQIVGNGTSWADYDNDGDLDVYVCSATSFLYRNDGGGTFTKITDGDIGDGTANRGWSCAWADFNNDGYLDLAITHPAGFVLPFNNPTNNHLLVNNGPPDFTFERITSGPIVTGPLTSYTVGTWSDFDLDGDIDYFIGAGPANGTTQADFLYRNMLTESGSATFERLTSAPIATDPQDGQIWNWIDYDNDGDLDGYVTNWFGSGGGLANNLYRNDAGSYTRITQGAIVNDADVSLSSVWGDFDNDGDLDCFVANDFDNTKASPDSDRYYRNNGDGTFTRDNNIALAEANIHRGASAGDYDDDGDLDLVAVGPQGATNQLSLFRNDTDNGNHWLLIRVVGVTSNRSGIGARLHAKATIAGEPVWQMREVLAQNTFNGQNSLRVHFGLADATVIDSLIVRWPSGQEDRFEAIAVDQIITVTEAGGVTSVPDQGELLPRGIALEQNYPNPFNPTTSIAYRLDQTATVSIAVYNLSGERVRTLVNEVQGAGGHTITWNGRDSEGQAVASGIYFYKLSTEGVTHIRKMTLLK